MPLPIIGGLILRKALQEVAKAGLKYTTKKVAKEGAKKAAKKVVSRPPRVGAARAKQMVKNREAKRQLSHPSGVVEGARRAAYKEAKDTAKHLRELKKVNRSMKKTLKSSK